MASIKMPLVIKLPLHRRRGCSVPAPRAVPCLGQRIPPSCGSPGSQAPHGARPRPARPVPCPELAPAALHQTPALGLVAVLGGVPAAPCPSPQPFSGDQVWDGSFGGHNRLLCLSPGSSQVALIAANLFNCQKYNRSTVPSVLGRKVCPVSRRLVDGSLWSCVHLQHPQPQRPSAARAGSPAALAMPVPGSQERGCGLGAAGPG